jgi:glycosyltransferase involved in cell wall biosynthesis
MFVSFLVPVYSEVESLRKTVALLDETCDAYEREILLIVHRASAPECLALCEDLAARNPRVRFHVQERYPGQGYAFREGFALARGTHFLMMNADLETEPRDALRLIRAMEQGNVDLVIGSRWMRGGAVDVRGYGPGRVMVAYAFQVIFGRLFATDVRDLTFCYKIGTRELFESIAWSGTGHDLALETTVRPIALGYRVTEIPTVWVARSEGQSNQPFLRNLRHAKLAFEILFTSRQS